MRVPPLIDAESGVINKGITPPPILSAVPPQSGSVPPVINSSHSLGVGNVQPPPVPIQVIQQELLNGCLSGAAAGLEQERRQAKREGWKGVLWSAIFALVLVSKFAWFAVIGNRPGREFGGNADIAAISVCGAIGAAALGFACYYFARSWKGRRRYCAAYKKQIFTAAIRLLNPTFRYQPDRGIPLERVRESRIFLNRIDQYYSEDYVQGVQGATAFEFAEVRASYKVRRVFKRADEDDIYRPVLHGLYFIADFNKHFTTSAIVLPKNGEQLGAMTQVLDNLGWKRGKIVHLEDPEFEREFTVHAEDPVEVRYLLTPALMRRILEITRARGGSMSLSFLREQLHVALDCAGDLFEPDPDSSSQSIAQIQVFLNQVSGVLSLIDLLNLNTRLWSKR